MWVPSNDQIGTCVGKGFRSLALAGLGTMGVLGAPMSHHDHDINSLVERSNVRSHAAQRCAVKRAGTRRHAQPIRAGSDAGRSGCLADRVGRQEADAHASTFHDHRTAGLGQIPRRSDGVDLGPGEAGKRLAQGAVAEVAHVVVGQGKHVESGGSQP
jgi:hypothetical protein